MRIAPSPDEPRARVTVPAAGNVNAFQRIPGFSDPAIHSEEVYSAARSPGAVFGTGGPRLPDVYPGKPRTTTRITAVCGVSIPPTSGSPANAGYDAV